MVSKSLLNPFFTIITCTRNSGVYLPTCFASVKAQTFADYEHILVDGHSTDSTVKLISAYLKNNSRAHLYSVTPHGIAHAMNRGLEHAQGQYVYFLNSDDSFYNSNTLQQVHDSLILRPDLDWVFGNIHETTGHETIGFPPRHKIFQGKHPNILKFYNYIPHQGSFVKKSVFDNFGGFDESLKSMLDPEFWLRIAKHTSWDYIPIVVANYLIRPDSQSENISHAQQNTHEYELVQSRYLTRLEFVLAYLVNKFLR